MQALVFKKKLELQNVIKPQVDDNEALISVLYAGICNTDLEILKGYMGFKGIIGHEFVGIVVDCNDTEWIGKRVVGEINLGCGQCRYCLGGMARHCGSRSVLGIVNQSGCMAEYLSLPLNNLHMLPDSVSSLDAVFVEPLAAACEIIEQIHIFPTSTIAVLGDGKLGVLIAQTLSLTGAFVSVFGHQHSMCKKLRMLGINAVAEQISSEKKFDIVVEATGSIHGLNEAIKAVKPCGTIVLKSTIAELYNIDLSPIVINEIKIIGSRCGPFKPAIRLLEKKLVSTQQFISSVFPFKAWEDAFLEASQGTSGKVILQLEPSN
ncbi:alcohol dehydrogenase catalytic domain-containing protein [bacterium]|nr:alcohol dehydrogenase catalytic domain-containing protein [bacterium]